MEIVYTGPSPARIVMGAGRFDRNVPREVEVPAIAEKLLGLPHFSKVEAADKGKKRGEV